MTFIINIILIIKADIESADVFSALWLFFRV